MADYNLILTTKAPAKATYRFTVSAPYSIDALAKGRVFAEANGFTSYNLGIADPVNTAAGVYPAGKGPILGDFWDPLNTAIYSAPAA